MSLPGIIRWTWSAGGFSALTCLRKRFGNAPALGSAWPILIADGGVSGSFGSLTEPASGLAAGTRFDALYGSNAITLAVTPSFYGNLAAAGVAESSSERAVGSALDAIRPAPGVAMDPARSALFGPLYTLPAGSIAVGLDELAPSIYPGRDDHRAQLLVLDGQCGQRPVGGAARPGRRSRRQQRARTERQHDLGQRSRRLRQHRRRRWLTRLHRGAGRHGGRHRHAGGRHRTRWRGDRNGRGADLVAGRRRTPTAARRSL